MYNTVPFLPENGWAIVGEEDFLTYAPDAAPGDPELSLLVKVDQTGYYSGDFRLVLAGLTPLRAQIPASSMLTVSNAAEYRLTMETRPEEICFRLNGVTSNWIDVDQR